MTRPERNTWNVVREKRCLEALDTLDQVLDEKPEQLHEEVSEVLRCLVALRDHLIDRRRRSIPSPELDEQLDKANAVLSVMTSGSFPVVGMKHDRLKKARDLMADLIESTRPKADRE